MTKNELIKRLQEISGNLEIRIDNDENGWFDVECVDEDREDGGLKFINIKSSNET